MSILSIILFLLFLVLGGFHFYWLMGGKWGLEKVIPTTKEDNSKNIPIPKFATLIVAIVLMSFGLVYLMKSGFITVALPPITLKYVYWFIPAIFILRAIGEFKYVGLFKKVKNTEFAKADSNLFIPLCLIIGIVGILIQLIDLIP